MDLSGDLAKMKVVDLKAALAERGLDTKGIKAVLVSRLEAALAEENNGNVASNQSNLQSETQVEIAADANESSGKMEVDDTPADTTADEPVSKANKEEVIHENVENVEAEPPTDSVTTESETGDACENNSSSIKPSADEENQSKKRASSVEPNADDFTKEEDEPELKDDEITLSWYDSDIHLKIDQSDFLRAKPISDAGLNLVWAGARSSHGVTEGKIAFEVYLSNYNRTNHNQDEKRMHEFRCGWSTEQTNLQLGESEFSFAYDTNAKKCTNCKFEDYGKRYGLYDVVGVYLDLESSPCKIEYTLNGESLGTAFEFEKDILDGKALYPHISTKNIGFVVNFGTVIPSLYSTVPAKPKENRRNSRDKRVKSNNPSAKTESSDIKVDSNTSSNNEVENKEEKQENTDETDEAVADTSCTKSEEAVGDKSDAQASETKEEKPGDINILTSYTFINTVPLNQMAVGPRRPESRDQCEVIMMIGLPGTGKTYWARNYVKEHPEKRYNAFGVAFLLEKMKVNGEPRKPNNSFKWSHMVESLSKSLNILHNIACRRRRHYIIDQPNAYANLQRRKMSRFGDFRRIAVVVFPTEEERKLRGVKRIEQQGKEYSPANVEEMHAKFSIPVLEHQWFHEIIFTDLNEEAAREAVKKINEDGATAKNKRKTEREARAKQRSRQFQGGRNGPGMWNAPMRGGNWDRRPGEGYGYGRPPREQWNAPNWMRGNGNFRRGGGNMGNFPQRRPGPNKVGNEPKRQKTDQAWGGNWNSFGGGGFQQNNAWAQPVWSRGHQNANGASYGGGNWWQ